MGVSKLLGHSAGKPGEGGEGNQIGGMGESQKKGQQNSQTLKEGGGIELEDGVTVTELDGGKGS